jgi:transposase-like protein
MEEMTMAGRYAAGPEYVDHLEGSPLAKQRAKVILQTLQGGLRVQDACQLLGICEQRFHQLREEMLQAAVARLEARPAGRPRRAAEPAEVQALKEQLVAQELALRVAHLREEIALAMPHLTASSAAAVADPEKKTPARNKRRARPGWWRK